MQVTGRIEDEHHARPAARAAGQSATGSPSSAATGGAPSRARRPRRPPRRRVRGTRRQRGDRVAILSLNSDRYLEYLFAVPWADAVLNPINTRWSRAGGGLLPARLRLPRPAGRRRLRPAWSAALREQCPQLKTVIHAGDGATPDGMLAYEDLLPRPRRSPTRCAAATAWPASSTPAAPPASPRA